MSSSRAILPKIRKRLEGLSTAIRREQVEIAKQYHLKGLQDVVAPFDSRIEFNVQSRYDGGNYITNIGPSDNIAGQNAADKDVTSKELFMWLDEGTSVTTVVMPEDFTNETSPNSIDTSHADYDREEIFFSGNIYPGMEARNFLRLTGELYVNAYRNNMNSVIQRYLGG